MCVCVYIYICIFIYVYVCNAYIYMYIMYIFICIYIVKKTDNRQCAPPHYYQFASGPAVTYVLGLGLCMYKNIITYIIFNIYCAR